MSKATFGHFTPDGMEYVVTVPHSPRDWFNYMWNPTYLACVSQSFNGMSLYQDDKGVVTNLFGKQDMRDDPRWVYVRDNKTGEVWSAGYYPCWTEHQGFECRHGLGYSVLKTLHNGIRLEFRIFVPRKDAGEIWTVAVTNESGHRRDLSIFTAAKIMLDGVNMPYGYFGGLSAEYLPKDQMLFFKNTTHTVVKEKYRGFVYSDVKPSRWDVSRDHFLGKYRSEAKPERVAEGRLGNSIASCEHLIGALQFDMALAPKGSRTINQVLGIVMDLPEARKFRNAFRTGEKIEKEFQAMKMEKLARLGGLKLETPDEGINSLFSVWLKHQLYLMADWARFYFKGYRDTCQDSAGMSVINPDRALAMLKKALSNQRSDGFCPRAFRVASMDIAAADKHYADSPSWISHATDAILRETGDLSLLDHVVEYSDKGKGTIWEHNLKAVEFLWNDRGAHGLSLLHYGDWNDLIDKAGIRGKGEGVWMSFALARVLNLVGQIAEWRGDTAVAKKCRARHAILAKNILKHGWDGKYFLYAISDGGQKIGSRASREGKVFINPQSWAVLSGVVDAKRYTGIAEHIEPMVNTPVGPAHSWPPFTKYDGAIGQLTGTPAGYCTNGNVYCHAAGFKIAADLEAGRTDVAFANLKKILPSPDKSEPYAQANGYVGPTAHRMVRHVSDDPWRTGTVAWHFLNVVDRLLGFRRTLGGFHLEPQIPSAWKQLAFTRPFRGIVFQIEILRGARPGIWVDGHPIAGTFIPVPAATPGKKVVHIKCVIG